MSDQQPTPPPTQPPPPAAPSAPKPRKRGRGAPPGNRNAVRHGLTSGSDPEPYITRLVSQFRQPIEAAVLAAVGSITVAAASEIQAACEWESHRIKVKRWLKKAGDSLSPEQKLAFSREAAKAASERTKHLKALCLGMPAAKSLWATLDAEARDVERQDAWQPLKPSDAATSEPGPLTAAEVGHSSPPSAGLAAEPSATDARIPLMAALGGF